MQNSKILDILCNTTKGEKFSFVIDKDKANEVTGDVSDTLEANNYMVKNVELIFLTKEVVVVRSNLYSDFNGWISEDSAFMLSCIKKVYREGTLVFDNTTRE